MNFLLESIKNTEIDDLTNRMLLLFEQNQVADDHLHQYFAELQMISDNITKAINTERVKSTLFQKDSVRKTKLSALNFILKGYLYSPLAEISKTAKELFEIFAKYGLEITRLNYSELSSMIESMILDFADENLQEKIQKLPGLEQILEELRLAQTDFTTSRVQHELNLSKLKEQKTATAIKKDLLHIINNKIAIYLSAMAMVNANKYAALDFVLDKIVSDMNEIVRRRKRGKKDSTSEELN